jgi:hypothetical protein
VPLLNPVDTEPSHWYAGIFDLVAPTGEIALAALPRKQLCDEVLVLLFEHLEVSPQSMLGYHAGWEPPRGLNPTADRGASAPTGPQLGGGLARAERGGSKQGSGKPARSR